MKRLIIPIVFLLFAVHIIAQQVTFTSKNPAYIENVKAGEAALNAEKYDSCLIYYATAFDIKQTSVLSTLRAAACAFSNDNKEMLKNYLDTAFALSWETSKGIYDSYPEFNYLKNSAFNTNFNNRYNTALIASGVNIDLIKEMEQIQTSDQLHRGKMRSVEEKYGWKSPQMDSLWALQTAADEANTKRIIEIIDAHGYPGKSLVGSRYMGTAFLVIQHSDPETQQKYLPLLKKTADDGQVRWSSVALLIDRVNLGLGKKQIYGSQVHSDPETGEKYFAEIENPMKIDSIRTEVGLGPIQEYGNHWDIKWDPNKHIERHAAIKKKEQEELNKTKD